RLPRHRRHGEARKDDRLPQPEAPLSSFERDYRCNSRRGLRLPGRPHCARPCPPGARRARREELMFDVFRYSFFQDALIATLLASVACGIIGTYVVVKRTASISGGLSHAALGGVGFGYLLGFPPLIGATIFSLISGYIMG